MKKQKEVNVKCGRFGCVWSKGKECEKDRVVLDTDGVCKSYELFLQHFKKRSDTKMLVRTLPCLDESNHNMMKVNLVSTVINGEVQSGTVQIPNVSGV